MDDVMGAHQAAEAVRGPVRVRLRPLEGTMYEYRGGEDEVPAVRELLLGAPVVRQPGGDIVLSCPMPREGGEQRTAVLSPGRLLVVFDGPPFRFFVLDPRSRYILGEEASGDG